MPRRLIFLAALQIPLYAIAAEECKTAQCREKAVMQREMDMQAKYPGKIQRKGDTIIIRAASGKIHAFKDNKVDDGEDFIVYELLSVLPGLDWVMIEAGYIEGRGLRLVSLNSGQMIETDGSEAPIPSPDNKRLMFYSYDMDAGYSSNYIAIYRIDKSDAKLELLLSGDRKISPSGEINFKEDSWGPSNPRWFDSATVTFDEDRYVDEGGMQSTHIQLKLINGKWQRIVIGNSPVVKNK